MSSSMNEARVRIRRLLFAWLAVSTALAITACHKGERSLPPTPTASPESEPAPQEQTGDNDYHPGTGGGGVPGSEVILDPRGMRPSEIFKASERLGPTEPGRAAGKNIYYSGSGQDFLREQLMSLVNSERNRAQRARNEAFAREIRLTTFEVTRNQEPKVSITLFRKNTRIELPDVIVKPNGDRLYTGFEETQNIAIDAACMDIASENEESLGCKTVHLRLTRKEKGGVAIAHVLARKTSAYHYAQGNPAASKANKEYEAIYNMLKSDYQPGVDGTIQSLAFYTTEVINGVSEFAVMMSAVLPDKATGSLRKQLVGWHGPLVKPRRSMDLKLLVKAPEVTRIVRGQRVKVPFRDVGTTHLVRNDGRGNLQFNIAVSRRPSDVIKLTIARIHTPTRTKIVLR